MEGWEQSCRRIIELWFTSRLFHRAVPKDASSTVPVANRDMETIMSKALEIPTPKAAKYL